MRRWDRIVLLVGLVALAPVLAGCENFDMDKLDVFHINDKKKLPGERKPLFPEGVPGVSQGIPPEYLKGNQPADTAQTLPGDPGNPPVAAEPTDKSTVGARPNRTAAVEPLQTEPKQKIEPKPKPKHKAKAKLKPKPATASAPSQPAAQQSPQAPWPAAAPAEQQQAEPAPQPAPWPGQAATTTTPWPSAPPPGTFSR